MSDALAHSSAFSVSALLAAQLALQTRLLSGPRQHAAWYNAIGSTPYVLGMLASAFALRSL
jgi:chlorophyll synthase